VTTANSNRSVCAKSRGIARFPCNRHGFLVQHVTT